MTSIILISSFLGLSIAITIAGIAKKPIEIILIQVFLCIFQIVLLCNAAAKYEKSLKNKQNNNPQQIQSP